MKTTTTLGLFTTHDDAENAINELSRNGFSSKDISIVIKKDKKISKKIVKPNGKNVSSGLTTGATAGSIVGGLAGLLIGIGVVMIPGVGALLIAGPLALGLTGATASTASGVLTGALAGGLFGALIGLGISEKDAKLYETKIKEGAVLLGVPTTDTSEGQVRKILEQCDGKQVKTINNSF